MARHGRSALAKARARAAFSLGNAKPAPKLAAGQQTNLAVDDIELASPSVHSEGYSPATIASENTCDGANRTPALHWKSVPAGTAELVLFAISTTPVDHKLFFDWAVAGLSPTLQGITAGKLPAEAITGRNGYGQNGYSICPPAGKNETYVFALYAIPQRLDATPGFEPAALRKQALHTAHHSGLLVGSYQRK